MTVPEGFIPVDYRPLASPCCSRYANREIPGTMNRVKGIEGIDLHSCIVKNKNSVP